MPYLCLKLNIKFTWPTKHIISICEVVESFRKRWFTNVIMSYLESTDRAKPDLKQIRKLQSFFQPRLFSLVSDFLASRDLVGYLSGNQTTMRLLGRIAKFGFLLFFRDLALFSLSGNLSALIELSISVEQISTSDLSIFVSSPRVLNFILRLLFFWYENSKNHFYQDLWRLKWAVWKIYSKLVLITFFTT